MTDPLKNKKDDQNVWVENLATGDSVYRSDRAKDNYPMQPNGHEGSVISVPVKVAKEAFFRRAVSRGKLRLLTDAEARARETELTPDVESAEDAEAVRLMKSMEKGSSDVGARFVRKDLEDDGVELQSISAENVLKGKTNKGGGTVRRSSSTASQEDGVERIPVVLEAPVKEGELESDTGV